MKIIQKKATRGSLNADKKMPAEKLPNGQSVTEAIFMGGRACCGSAFVEKIAS